MSPGRLWDKLVRDASPAPQADTDLRVDVVGPELADAFADVVLARFGMPPQLHGFVAAQTDTPGWTTYGAFDGDRLVGVAALYADGDIAALSGAATLPGAGGRGAPAGPDVAAPDRRRARQLREAAPLTAVRS